MVSKRYIIRLDDASEKRDIEKWDRIEELLDRYQIRPLVGVIPKCEDPMMEKYPIDADFWGRVHSWQDKGWSIAMHGYRHVYDSNDGGINPVNSFSEFAGHPLEVQREKIRAGIKIFKEHDIVPKVFFAPGHTFDENTLSALKLESNIGIISDTIAWDMYSKNGFIFIPQQSGGVRWLPFNCVTFCYHPNTMYPQEYEDLGLFLDKYSERFSFCYWTYPCDRKYRWTDVVIRGLYFRRHGK